VTLHRLIVSSSAMSADDCETVYSVKETVVTLTRLSEFKCLMTILCCSV